MKTPKRVKMMLLSISAPLLFVLAFTIVVSTYSHFHTPPQVELTTTGFAPHTIEIQEGSTLHFVNQSSTVTQTLCLGTNTHCQSTVPLTQLLSPPPRDLLNRVHIAPGQAKDVFFDIEGKFYVTSAVTSGMNLTIVVDASQ